MLRGACLAEKLQGILIESLHLRDIHYRLAMAKWTSFSRVVRFYRQRKPWKGVRERLEFKNAMGYFLRRVDIGANP